MTKVDRTGPEIIAAVGGLVDETGVCLAIYGADLDPGEVTVLMGCQPTHSHRRGDLRDAAAEPWPSGAWLLTLRGEAPTGPEQLIRRLLMTLPVDQAIWSDLSSRFDIQLRIAVHFTDWNKGFDLSADLIAAIGRMHASLGCDLYAYGSQDA